MDLQVTLKLLQLLEYFLYTLDLSTQTTLPVSPSLHIHMMSTHGSVDMTLEQPPIHFGWILGDKIRDGRLGPVFTALRPDTGDLLAAEKLVLDESGTSCVTTDRVLSHLKSKRLFPSQPNVVSYLGYQLREGHIFILTEYLPGGTLREFVQKHGEIPQPLARSIVRQLVLGLEQLQAQGFSVVFLDLNSVFLNNRCDAKIEAPLLDTTSTGQPFPPSSLTIPEIGRGQNLRKADIWLLGIILVQLLTGEYNLEGAGFGTHAVQTAPARGSALELWLTQGEASRLDEQASGFLRQCLTL